MFKAGVVVTSSAELVLYRFSALGAVPVFGFGERGFGDLDFSFFLADEVDTVDLEVFHLSFPMTNKN